MVFAKRVAKGVKGTENCPEIKAQAQKNLDDYMGGFRFD
jgi:hypothetical protein